MPSAKVSSPLGSSPPRSPLAASSPPRPFQIHHNVSPLSSSDGGGSPPTPNGRITNVNGDARAFFRADTSLNIISQFNLKTLKSNNNTNGNTNNNPNMSHDYNNHYSNNNNNTPMSVVRKFSNNENMLSPNSKSSSSNPSPKRNGSELVAAKPTLRPNGTEQDYFECILSFQFLLFRLKQGKKKVIPPPPPSIYSCFARSLAFSFMWRKIW